MLFDQINLTTREHIDHRIRFLLFGGMAMFVIFISIANLIKGYQLYKERAAYQEKLAQLHQQAQGLQADVTGRNAIEPKAYKTLMDKGIRVNRKIALDLFPWVKVLDALEKALPDAVIIDSFRPVNGFTRINLTGHTDSLEKLVGLQKRLENSDLFTAVVLDNMGIGDSRAEGAKQNAKSRMAFELHCRLRLDQILPEETHGLLWRAIKKAPKS